MVQTYKQSVILLKQLVLEEILTPLEICFLFFFLHIFIIIDPSNLNSDASFLFFFDESYFIFHPVLYLQDVFML